MYSSLRLRVERKGGKERETINEWWEKAGKSIHIVKFAHATLSSLRLNTIERVKTISLISSSLFIFFLPLSSLSSSPFCHFLSIFALYPPFLNIPDPSRPKTLACVDCVCVYMSLLASKATINEVSYYSLGFRQTKHVLHSWKGWMELNLFQENGVSSRFTMMKMLTATDTWEDFLHTNRGVT